MTRRISHEEDQISELAIRARVARLLQKHFLERKLSRTDFAKYIGVTRATIYLLEDERMNLSVITLRRICMKLGVSADSILGTGL